MNMKWLQEQVQDRNTDWLEYGNVRVSYSGDLAIFNYTLDAEKENRWNWLERVSRGLMLNWKTGEIVARSFDKFHNYGHRGHYPDRDAYMIQILEKLDGSLGILYHNQESGFAISTRGSLESEQAIWATDYLNRNFDLYGLPDEWTLIFEIIYPENRIVVNYDGFQGLVLLAIRNRFTGDYVSWNQVQDVAMLHGFELPKVYNFHNVTEILENLDHLGGNKEGYVVEYSDGSRFKFKGDRYLELHRIVTNATFNRILEAVRWGTYDDMIANVPDEFLQDIKTWKRQIDFTVQSVSRMVESVFELAPKNNRKIFAGWVMENYKSLAPYLFNKLDGKDYRDLICKKEFK